MKPLSMSSKFSDATTAAIGTAGPGAASAEAPGQDGGTADASAKFLQSPQMDLVKSLLGALLGNQQPAQPKMDEHSACDSIAKFMESTGKNTLDTGEMKNLAAGKGPDGSGDVPPGVQHAAAFIMGGPKGDSGESARWQNIETKDVAGADGLSGLGNFKAIAAEGKPAAAPQGGDNMEELLKMFSALQQQNAMLAQMMTQGLGGGGIGGGGGGFGGGGFGGIGASSGSSSGNPVDDIVQSFAKMQQDATKNVTSMLQSAV